MNDISSDDILLLKQRLAEQEALNRALLEKLADREREIDHLQTQLDKLRRMNFGSRSEKVSRRIAQMEADLNRLQKESDTLTGRVDDPAVQRTLRQTRTRKPFPESLPRDEKRLRPAGSCCPECGGALSYLGEDAAEQLELMRSAFRVIRTVREKHACTKCDAIVQAPAPSRPIERGIAGPGLMARVLTSKYAEHTPLQPKNKRIRWLEPHEARRLIDECPEPLKSVVEFALSTGLRRSNIINLEWQQIDMQRKVAWIHPEQSKSNQAIGVALNDTACRVLKKQIGNHHKWVFVYKESSTKPDGTKSPVVRKMRYDANTAWRAALKRSGIEDFRFHDLRHTWASWLVQAGVPISVLQEMGGWESIEMVRRYAHLAPNHLTEHARQIDSIFGSSVPNLSHSENKEGTNDA